MAPPGARNRAVRQAGKAVALTATDARTTLSEADAITDWTSGCVLYTADPDPIESTGCLGIIVSNALGGLRYAFPAADYSNTLIYVWMLAMGAMATKANQGSTILVTDGTNVIHYEIAGADVASFRHDLTQNVRWQCMVLDTDNLPDFYEVSGSESSLDWGNLTGIGAGFRTLAKAKGNVENCFVDVIRCGVGGLIITAGTSGDPGEFSEIAAEDADNSDDKALGICRQLGAGMFGLQGMLTFGDNAGSTATYFKDSNVTVAFEDRGLATNRYGIKVAGNSTGSTTFWLIDSILLCPSGVGAYLDASDADLQVLILDGVRISGFDQGVDFSADATNAPNHDVLGCTFYGCDIIDPGKVVFERNTIQVPTNANGGILLDADGTGAWGDLVFISDGSGHAIYITAPGTYTFNNFTYSGYGADSTTDAVVYNNSGGAVTINVVGGDTPTVRNGTSASTTVNNNTQVTLTGLMNPTEVRVYDHDTGVEIAGQEDVTTGTYQFSDAAGNVVDIRIFAVNYKPADILNFTIPTTDTSLPIQQVLDRSYSNPA